LGNLEIDTSAYGSQTGDATAFANQTTVDSTIGIDVEYIFPQHPDTAEFVLIKYKLYNRTEADILGLVVGAGVDFDVTPGPDSVAGLQSGSQNTGHLSAPYNMIYQQGTDSLGHTIAGDHTATRFRGGITSIQCGPAPRAWIAPNDPWLFGRPGGGFHEGYLYDEMTETGFEIFPPEDPDPEEDLHSVMTFEQDVDLAVGTMKRYVVGLVSSNTGNLADETDILETTAKAWKYAFGWSEFVEEYTTTDENTPVSFPYYAIGSHEGGLAGGCCGCIITEILDEDNVFSLSPDDDCSGTLTFAGGTYCGSGTEGYQATYQVTDLCEQYSDVIKITVIVEGPCSCNCPYQSDWDEDGFITPLDLGSLIDVLFAGDPPVQDPACPTVRGDFDCDTFPTPLDLGNLIDYLFASGPGPCNPCTDLK
jgi:hypothetical protein